MSRFLVKMCYSHVDLTRPALDEAGNEITNDRGGRVWERIPNHPTRLATLRDFNCWWEEKSEDDLRELMKLGPVIVRRAE